MTGIKKVLLSLVGVVLLALFFMLGVFVGGELQEENTAPVFGPGMPMDVNFSPLWEAWETIETKYRSAENGLPSDDELVWGAIEGVVESLDDPYSTFLPPEELTSFEESINGNFGGVGMEVGKRDDVLVVITPLEGTPADAAGLQAGDRIIAIDEELTADMSVDEAVLFIRGEPGTTVTLTISRDGELFDVPIQRSIINVPSVESRVEDGTFIIRIFSFSAAAPEDFRRELRNFILSGSDNLILDLRGNPGGFLLAAVDMASWFLPQGEIIVREEGTASGENVIFRSRGYDVFNRDVLDLAILIDGGTASAAEILAGALQEHGIATLVGTETFGKGSVQELIPMEGGGALKLTTAQWLTPNRHSITDNGLTPDVGLAASNEEATDDLQLNRAIEIVTADDF